MPIAFSVLTVQETNNGPDLTRYVLVCFGLLLGILGVAYLFKRFLADNLRRKAARRSLRVVDVLPLGGKQKLVVVSCYDRNFLLGLGEKEVSSIAELDAALEAEEPPAAEDPPATGEPTTAEEPARPFRATLAETVIEEEPVQEPVPRRQAPWDDSQGIFA